MATIDLYRSTAYNHADLKARGMSRLNEQFGLAELIGGLSRAVFSLRGEYVPSVQAEADIAALGAAMEAEEVVYLQERADNVILEGAIAYETAEKRLLESVPDVPATVDDGEGGTIANPILENDAAERVAAQSIVDAATVEATDLVALRLSAQEAV